MEKSIKLSRRIAAVFLSVLLLCTMAFAAYPQPADVFYVLDEANVLDESTEAEIILQNEVLEEKTGAQVCVVTVQFTGSESTADYAYGLFNEWGIGDAEKDNGVLLLVVTGAEDYYLLQGTGLEDYLSSAVLQNILDEWMEPSFAKGNYSEAVQLTVNALMERLSSYYGVSLQEDGNASQSIETKQPSSISIDGNPTESRTWGPLSWIAELFSSLLKGVFVVVFIVIAIIVIALSVGGSSRRRNTWGYRGHRPPPPPPPRGGFGGYNHRGHRPPSPPPRGGFGGFNSRPGGMNSRPNNFGGSHHSGGFGGSGRSGGFGGGGHSGGFGGHSGGGGASRGGGAGRR